MNPIAVLLILLQLGAGVSPVLSREPARDVWESIWETRLKASLVSSGYEAQKRGTYDWRYASRAEFAADDTKYLLTLMHNNALLNAPDIEDYVSRLLLQVHPGPLPDGHPGALHVRISIDPAPNAFALSNGTLMVTTGVLVAARTEDELKAILAHEVGHIYGDHRMQAKGAAESRAALVGALTVLTGIGAGIAAGQSNDPSIRASAGTIGLGAAFAVGALSGVTAQALGFAYSRKQEKEADQMAQRYLRACTADTLALARVLLRMSEFGRMMGEEEGTGLVDTHPGVKDRLGTLGVELGSSEVSRTRESQEVAYDANVAKVLSGQSHLALLLGRHEDAYAYASRAVRSGWGDASALVRESIAIRLLFTQPDSLKKAEQLLDLAEVAGGDSTAILVQRTLLQLRRGDEASALRGLDAWLAAPRSPLRASVDEGVLPWAQNTRSQLALRRRE